MFRHYLTSAFRNFIRHKRYTFINMFGLSAGFICFIFIFLFIRDELKYDRFHENADRIFRVTGKLELEGQGEQSSSCPFPLGPALIHDYPHLIAQQARFFNFQDPQHTLRYGDKKLSESGLFVADSSALTIFNFPLAQGNPASALSQPNSIVIDQDLAKRYFGDDNPMDKTLRFDGVTDLKVTGVFADIPEQSHIHFDGLISFSTIPVLMPNIHKNWVWNPCWTYVLLKDGVSPDELKAQFPAFVQKYYPDFLKPQVSHSLQPLTDIHLTSKLDYEIEPNGDKGTLIILGMIGIFILLIACINFINLSTARAATRAKEVGMRKVSGASRRMLIVQYVTESLLISFLALLFSLVLVELLLPVFNRLADKTMTFDIFRDPLLWITLITTGLLAGFAAGFYPALVLSKFEPVRALKGGYLKGRAKAPLRKALVVVQFAVSLVLIISTITIWKQLSFLRSVDLGFEREQVLMIPVRPPMAKMFKPFTDELKALPDVVSVATMNDVVGSHHNTHEYHFDGMPAGSQWVYYPSLLVDEDFVETMDMEMVAGRDFSDEFVREDSFSVIVNEALVDHMGWGSPQEALGREFHTPTGNEKIIGVVKNFNFVSLEDPVTPFVLDVPHRLQKNYWTRYIAVRMKDGDHGRMIGEIEKTWNEMTVEFPFEYFFLDDKLNGQYRSHEKLNHLTVVFSMLAILIATMGLFALASFMSEQRTKEIGIRKVLGASTAGISLLLSQEFLKPVLVAVVIAWPVAWLVTSRWLENFAYRVDIPWMWYVAAAAMLLAVAQATVLAKAWFVAGRNPARALRYE